MPIVDAYDSIGDVLSGLTTSDERFLVLSIALLHVIDEVECLWRRYLEAASAVTAYAFNGSAPTEDELEQPFRPAAVVILTGDRTQTVTVTPGSSGEAKLSTLVRSSALLSWTFSVMASHPGGAP